MIDCFVPSANAETISNLKSESLVSNVYAIDGPMASTVVMKQIAAMAKEPFVLLYIKETSLRMVHFALERMVQIAEDTGAAMLYADHFNDRGPAPVIDYQDGSLRDDFDFGGLLLYRTSVLKEAVAAMDADYKFAALYDLRLRASRLGKIEHIGEYLYYEVETDKRKSGEKLFDYVDPKNRAVQIEMEQVVTAHLKAIGGYLEPVFKDVAFDEGTFEYEASVIIPCRNRVKTIGDALKSALSQKTSFKYNVIVVDDNSTDGTVDVIKGFLSDPKLVYIAQDKTYHAIGGNWNAALHHPLCGRFAIQLDSDDMYYDENTVQKFVDAFHEQGCAMVVGTYQMTDFNLNPLPPGVIDHREWTPENGRNNALRVNGFGAPRAFYVPLLRKLNFPTTKYGEDYAVALRVSRDYQIGRIYDVVYNCRRWDDNSDASLDVVAVNSNNYYKDRIRTWELSARIAKNCLKS